MCFLLTMTGRRASSQNQIPPVSSYICSALIYEVNIH